ncbi:MAG: hypothetical protein HCA25_22890 [Dolichospermum sp. DET50]|nr:hypothetical protein [Dolichospermum sp. DET66]MBS3035018.1 hypothetical protein [Dolichospermum sp. DET67]MBS3040218.1 hypothetical protein [Dolichospermum sp. DET50]QSX67384.1 MAG: hypothetical protein EZY12_22165 [Dolichospermum sp. DET69]
MQVNNLTIDQLKALIRETVRETIEELLTDSETNQTIKENFKQELLTIQKRRKTGARGISTAEVMQRLGLENR